MRANKEHIVKSISEQGVVPLFTHENVDDALAIVDAAYRGGMRVLEFTNRKPNSLEVFSTLIKQRHQFPDLLMGIGTIMDTNSTMKFIYAGADFIISPMLNLDMGKVCSQHNIHWIPGCATVTEIVTARDQGAEVIKVFPGSVVGPGFVSAVLSVIPELKLMITGGVEPNEANLTSWFKAGAMAVGLGSQLFTKDILDRRDWSQLQQNVADAIALVQQVKQKFKKS
jgi:2-dehydro-3-deoxyphosphogluconate aldolase/(4S)-4-hydroxy-2-oxoglutarate aldolase